VPTNSAADFVDALREYRILEPAQLEKVSRAMKGKSVEPRAVAKELLKQGWVTPYQVNQLLQGRGAELVLGDYLLLERLGEGGMGQVFKARHRLMDRTVAIKVIRKELLAHPGAVERFQREIRLIAQLDHPHLVRAHDAARVGDTLYLVTEYLEGTDLHRLVQKSGPLPVGYACAYIRQAALGLQNATEHRLVHRDVKPSNLQLSADGRVVKVLDMGLARLQEGDGPEGAGGLTQAHSVMGTPDYIAPEQIEDARCVDSRADIYSLGCTMYFLLAGRPPFPDGRWEEKLVHHRKDEPQAIEQIRPDVPPELGAVLRKMMAKRPEDRYSTPAGVADALAPFSQMPGPLPAPVAAVPASLINQPSDGKEPGWTLTTGSVVAPSSAPGTPLPPRPMSSEPTVLVNTQQPASQASGPPTSVLPGQAISGNRNLMWLALAGGGALLAALVLLVVVLMLKGAKPDDTPKGAKTDGTEPAVVHNDTGQVPPTPSKRVLFDEDFSNKMVPEGWQTKDFTHIHDDEGGDALYVNKSIGAVGWMTVPISPLSGNFSIEGTYILRGPDGLGSNIELTISLRRERNVPLPVVFDRQGHVHIGKDSTPPPLGYKPQTLTHFLLKREGKKLSVSLNMDQVVDHKNLDEIAEYDTLRLGLSAEPGFGNRLVRLYGLKVATLPP